MYGTHITEGTVEEFELGILNTEEMPARPVAQPTPRQLWPPVRPPVRDFIFCDSASIPAHKQQRVHQCHGSWCISAAKLLRALWRDSAMKNTLVKISL